MSRQRIAGDASCGTRSISSIDARVVGSGRRLDLMTDPWLDKRGLAEHRCCSMRSIESAVAEGMPHALIFGRVKFQVREVEPWLEQVGGLEALEEKRAAAPRRRSTYVYVISGAGKVKIRIAGDPLRRLSSLQTGLPVPLELVRAIPTDRAAELEATLHRRWAPHRSHGERFRAFPVIADLETLTDDELVGLEPA